jgi:lysozyme
MNRDFEIYGIVVSVIIFAVAVASVLYFIEDITYEAPVQVSPEGLEKLKQFEGLELTAYQDVAGIWTIGYGHTGGVKEGDTITLEEAELLLRKDLRRFEATVSKVITAKLSQNQYDALVSFTYNVGERAFIKSTLRRKLNQGDYAGAAEEFPRWVYAGGKIVKGLQNRRAQERALFLGLS